MIHIACVDRPTVLKLRDGILPVTEAEAVRSHLEFCPRCRALDGELEDLVATMTRFSDTRAAGSCPDALVLASYAEGSLATGDRADCEAHLAVCGSCTGDLAALGRELAGLEVEPGVATPAWALARARALVEPLRAVDVVPASVETPTHASARAAVQSSGRRDFFANLRSAAWPAAAVASLAIIVLVQLPDPGAIGPAERGANSEASTTIVLTAPVHGMNLNTSRGLLTWEPVTGADNYSVIVVDASGGWVWEAQTQRPQVILPAGLRLTPGASYSWWVKTVLDSGEQIESAPARFTVSR